MHECSVFAESLELQSDGYRDYLVENAARCQVIACAPDDNEFARSVVALGQEYAAQAIARGADPTRLPGPEQWRWITDNLDRPRWPEAVRGPRR